MRYLMPVIICIVLIACKDKKSNGDETAVNNKSLPGYVKDLQESLRKYPDSTALRVKLADAYDSLGMYKESMAQVDTMIKADSSNNATWMHKGLLLEKMKDTTGAIYAYAKSINIYPSADAQLYLANLYAERRSDTALLLVNAVSSQLFDSRTLAECDFIAGIYHARKGNTKMAEQLFSRCIAQDLKFMEAYIEKGLLYFDQKKYADALKIFQAASTVEATYADAYYYQARCLEALGKTQDAINMYKQSLQLDPGLKESKEALARLGAQVG